MFPKITRLPFLNNINSQINAEELKIINYNTNEIIIILYTLNLL